jgi:hypothetical protein
MKGKYGSEFKILKRPSKNYFTNEGFRAAKAYLGNVLRGQPKIYTAPFAKGDSMEKILKDWDVTLVSIKAKWPQMYEYEIDLANKVGPMSVQQPLDKRMDDIRSYYEDILLPSEPIDARAIEAAIEDFSKIRGLPVRSQRETVDKMKKSTNSGTPYFTKRRNVVQDTVPFNAWLQRPGKSRFAEVETQLSSHWCLNAATIGWRGQEGGPSAEDTKQRVVWMFPFAINIAELQVYQPLIEAAQQYNIIPAWVSMEAVDHEITQLFDTKGKDDLIVCTDFSKFDQHFNADLRDAAKTINRSILKQNVTSDRWLEEIFPIKYLIPLIISFDGDLLEMVCGVHGMGSGSGGTNVDETEAHKCLQHEAAILSGEKLNPHSMCLGDDGVLTFPGITVDGVVEAYSKHGQECNKSKQYASTQDCVYLRRYHHTDYRVDGVCVGIYSTNRALGRLRYLERFMDPEYWTPEMVALRQYSIIENCKWHPLFHEFIEFCMKRDKYRLGLDIPGFLDNIAKYAQEATDHMPDFLGYTKTLQGEGPDGIADWEIVKYLKSLK